MPYGNISDESALVLRGQGLDMWAMEPEDGATSAASIDIVWDGALDESFLVTEEYAKEVVDHLADALSRRPVDCPVTVSASHVHLSDGAIEGSGTDLHTRHVGPGIG